MKRIEQTRKPGLSLWQSAIDQAVNSSTPSGARAVEGGPANGNRPDAETDSTVASVADFVKAVKDLPQLPDPKALETAVRGVGDSVLYCSSLALKLAGGVIAGLVTGNKSATKHYREELERKMGNCDVRYVNAALLYAAFKAQGGAIPYRRHKALTDFVLDMPETVTIGIVGDWGTGQEDAAKLLRLVKAEQPDIVIHLGDIYYSGTQFEVDNYFHRPWSRILKGVRSFALSGNHDMYSGGAPYYGLIDKFGQPASYFCLRNSRWQVVGIDTGRNANDGGLTKLEDSEVEWLRDKIENFAGKTILLSHHQLFSAKEDIEDHQSLNLNLYRAVDGLMDKIALWIWGHEHDLCIFDEYLSLKRGRCLGCSAFPVGIDEVKAIRFPETPIRNISLSRDGSFWALGFGILKLRADGSVTESYYQNVAPAKLFEDTFS